MIWGKKQKGEADLVEATKIITGKEALTVHEVLWISTKQGYFGTQTV